MQSNSRRFNTPNEVRGVLYGPTHTSGLDSLAGQYLAHGGEPKEHRYRYNFKNLFHDSDVQDAKWLKRAKAYLAKSQIDLRTEH